jgi:hypothetical protein
MLIHSEIEHITMTNPLLIHTNCLLRESNNSNFASSHPNTCLILVNTNTNNNQDILDDEHLSIKVSS